MSETLRLNLLVVAAVSALILIAGLLHRYVGLGPYVEGTSVTASVVEAAVAGCPSSGFATSRRRQQPVRVLRVHHQGTNFLVPVRPDADIGAEVTLRLGAPAARLPAMLLADYERSREINTLVLTLSTAVTTVLAVVLLLMPREDARTSLRARSRPG